MPVDAHLGNISQATGRSTRLDALGWPGCSDKIVRDLLGCGFEAMAIWDDTIENLMLTSIDRCFAGGGGPARGDIDHVVIASETLFGAAAEGAGEVQVGHRLHRPLPNRKHLINTLIARAGLTRARPVGTSMGGCSNVSAALHLATALVRAGMSMATLVVIVEQLAPFEGRIMENAAAPLSDVALCFVVSPEGDYLVAGCHQMLMPDVVRMKIADEPLLQGLALSRASRDLINIACPTGDPRPVLTSDNFRRSFYDVAFSSSALTYDDLRLPSQAELGHAFGCEGIINAALLRSERVIDGGDEVLVLNYGRSLLAATRLRAR